MPGCGQRGLRRRSLQKIAAEAVPEWRFAARNTSEASGITYDAVGNVLSDGPNNGYYNSYTYDAENRPTSVSWAHSITYTYDAFGRRIEQDVSGTQYDYVYGQNGIADFMTASGVQWSLLAGRRDLGIYGNGTTTFFHVDWEGTLRATSTYQGGQLDEMRRPVSGRDAVRSQVSTRLKRKR